MGRVHRQQGAVLVLCMVVMVVVLALVASFTTLSGTNVQVATNQQRAARALASAESGLEVMRYWLSHVLMDATTPPEDYLQTIVDQVQLAAAGVASISLGDDGVLQSVPLGSTSGQNFSASLNMNADNPSVLDVTVKGIYQGMERTIRVGFHVAPYEHPIFKYGLATKGPIQFPNNPTTLTATSNWEADIYTESNSSTIAVQVGGNTNFDGNIYIANPLATVNFSGDVKIGGDTGQTAIDNHVSIGVDPVDFPAPDTSRFLSYATGPALDPTTTDLTKGLTLTNATIPANTNPVFDGTVVIEGVLLIEQPNVVTFNRNVELRGIMVGENGVYDAGSNRINIAGNFASLPLPSGSQFDALRQQEGSSIVTPDFEVSFSGNYSAIEGVVAAGTLHFDGNASAVVKGTLISFADSPTVIEGNVSLTFDRAYSVRIPAGFDTKRILAYNPSTYLMVN